MEEDEDDDRDDDEANANEQAISSAGLADIDETSPLIRSSAASRPRSKSRRRRNSVSVQGTASVTQAVFMVFFSRVTGNLHIITIALVAEIIHWNGSPLPWQGVRLAQIPIPIVSDFQHSFYNGGLLFSSITFVFIACISLYSFLLLVKTKFVVSGSFGGTQITSFVNYMN